MVKNFISKIIINNIEYKANYEEFIKAKNYATENFSFGDDINFSEQVARDKNVLEIVGFDKKGNVVDIDEGNQFCLRLIGSDRVVVGYHAKPKRTKVGQSAGGELSV